MFLQHTLCWAGSGAPSAESSGGWQSNLAWSQSENVRVAYLLEKHCNAQAPWADLQNSVSVKPLKVPRDSPKIPGASFQSTADKHTQQ